MEGVGAKVKRAVWYSILQNKEVVTSAHWRILSGCPESVQENFPTVHPTSQGQQSIREVRGKVEWI